MKKAGKITLIIFIVLGVLIGISYFASGPIIKKLLNNKITDLRIAGIYKIQYKKAYFDIFNLGISLTDIQLLADSSTESKKLFRYHSQIFQIHLKRLALTRLNLPLLIQENKLEIGKIKLIEPKVYSYKNEKYIGPAPAKENEIAFIEMDQISLKAIEVKDMSFEYFSKSQKKADLVINEIQFRLLNPTIYPDQFPELQNALKVEDIDLEINNISYDQHQSFYEFKLGKLTLDYTNSIIYLSDFKIDPRYDKKEFAKRNAFQTDRIELNIKHINIENYNIQEFIEHKIIAIKTIKIEGGKAEIYRDKNRPFNYKNFPKLPQQMLRNMEQEIMIDEIIAKKLDLVYIEKKAGAKKPGKIYFNKLQFKLNNLGNTSEWQQNRELKISAQSKIYNKAKVNAQFNFPLGSDTFYASGQLGKMNISAFNEMSVNNAGIKIEDGKLDKMDFVITANNKSSKGKLNLYYHDLEISLLKEEETGEIKKKKLLNLLANKFLIPKENPKKNGDFYTGIIDFKRDPNKGFFNYLWKSILSGTKDTFLKDHKDIQDDLGNSTPKTRREQRKKERAEKKRSKNND